MYQLQEDEYNNYTGKYKRYTENILRLTRMIYVLEGPIFTLSSATPYGAFEEMCAGLCNNYLFIYFILSFLAYSVKLKVCLNWYEPDQPI